MPAVVPREHVVAALAGQKLKLPSFDTVHQQWPSAVSPHLSWIREEVDSRLQEIINQRPNLRKPDAVLRKLVGLDFGLFTATWWPFESPNTLRLMSHMVIWLFLWDDEVDNRDGSYGSDFDSAQRYREQTLAFVANALRYPEPPESSTGKPLADSSNVLITSFQSIADATIYFDDKQRARLYREVELFIKATEIEQRWKATQTLPALEEYMECRMGSSAVEVLFALVDGPLLLPDADPTLAAGVLDIEHHANVMISVTNDILSLKKELAAGSPDSLIPILWQSDRSVESALASALIMLTDARRSFDEAETRLLSGCPPALAAGLRRFLTTAKTNCTGNLLWSLNTKRYGLSDGTGVDGIVIEL